MLNPWKELGANRQTTPEQLSSLFHDIAWKHHPDRGGSIEKFQAANQAYQILKDRKKTAAFLAQMVVLNQLCPSCKGHGVMYKQRGMTSRSVTTCQPCNGAGALIKEK